MVGKTLGDRYEILKLIGSGGMANVYLAHCKTLNRNVAIKVLKREFADDPEFLKRFITEAQAAAALNHPNIVSIYDYGREGDLRYIVMEYVEGQTLKEYIVENRRVPWQVAIGYAIQICKALEVAHRNGIIHRDIKPHNMIITYNGSLKVTDFGIARAASSKTATIAGDTTMGSVHYFSPEQARGSFTDAKSDIYSLGVVMYEMLTGKVPFDGDTPVAIAVKHIQLNPVAPSELVSSIPAGVEGVLLKAMSKEPAMRYSSAAEMLIDLQSVTVMPNVMPTVSKESTNTVTEGTMKYDSEETRRAAEARRAAEERRAQRERENSSGYSYNNRNRSNSNNKHKKKNKLDDDKKAAIKWAVITCVIIIALAVLGMSFVFGGFGPDNSNTVVPKLVGEDYETMVEMYKDKGFTITIGQEVEDSEYDEGIIIDQSPKAGKNVSLPKEIIVTVSSGLKEETMKDYKKIDAEKVESELVKKGYKVKIEKEEDDSIDEGLVIRTSPAYGEDVKKGDTIILYVSEGKGKEVTVPSVLGQTESQAKQVLEENKLTVGSIMHDYSSTVEKGRVMNQSHSSGTKLSEGTAVSITISDGPAPVEETPAPTNAPVTPTNPPEPVETIVDGVVAGGGMVEQ